MEENFTTSEAIGDLTFRLWRCQGHCKPKEWVVEADGPGQWRISEDLGRTPFVLAADRPICPRCGVPLAECRVRVAA